MNLEEIFKSKNISNSSINLYSRNLLKLNDNKKIENLNFLNNITKILTKINKITDKLTTKRNYIISIVSLLSILKNNNRKITNLYNKYFEVLNELNNSLKNTNEKSITENKNWIEKEELDNIYNNLKEEIDKIKKSKDLDINDYNKYLSYIILSLYYLQPPRRNKDYQNMVIINDINDGSDKNKNYLSLNDKKFIFNNFKTEKTYKSQTIDIKDDLLNILKEWIKYKNKYNKSDLLLNWSNGSNLKNVNDITRILNKIFKKNISSSMLRKMFHTNKYGSLIDELNKDSNNMSHSVSTILNHYIKN